MTRRGWSGVAALALGVLALWWFAAGPGGAARTGGANVAMGAVDTCRKGPRFQAAMALGPRAAVGTSLTDITGIAILDPDGNAGRGSVYQHETWDDAGFLGPFVTDREGNIYVAPVPLVSLVENPPQEQNRVYRVDTDSQEMVLMADLPPARPPGGNSPFGVVGLAYDCETDSLYASSLAGSTAADESGRIFRIDLGSGEPVDHVDGFDAIGVGVFRGSTGKRVYAGAARSAEVRSAAVDASGDIVGPWRTDVRFAEQVQSGRRTVRKIRFQGADRMILHVIDFNYSLQVASERLEDVITYGYDATTDTWTHLDTQRLQ